MAYIESRNCVYCGEIYSVVHGTIYSIFGSYTSKLINGHPEDSKQAWELASWCGKCSKRFDIDKIKNNLAKIGKDK